MNYPHPILAREGWPFIAASFVVAVLASFVGYWSLPFWLIFIFCLQFFRDPARVVAGGPNSVLAPADGRIVVVEESDDPYLKRRALKISVFMNVFNVHSNRAPIASTVQRKWYDPGSFLNAALDKASQENLKYLDTIQNFLQVSPGSIVLLRGHVDDALVARSAELQQ